MWKTDFSSKVLKLSLPTDWQGMSVRSQWTGSTLYPLPLCHPHPPPPPVTWSFQRVASLFVRGPGVNAWNVNEINKVTFDRRSSEQKTVSHWEMQRASVVFQVYVCVFKNATNKPNTLPHVFPSFRRCDLIKCLIIFKIHPYQQFFFSLFVHSQSDSPPPHHQHHVQKLPSCWNLDFHSYPLLSGRVKQIADLGFSVDIKIFTEPPLILWLSNLTKASFLLWLISLQKDWGTFNALSA